MLGRVVFGHADPNNLNGYAPLLAKFDTMRLIFVRIITHLMVHVHGHKLTGPNLVYGMQQHHGVSSTAERDDQRSLDGAGRMREDILDGLEQFIGRLQRVASLKVGRPLGCVLGGLAGIF